MNLVKRNPEPKKIILSDREVAELMYRVSLMSEGGRSLSLLILPALVVFLFWGYIDHTELLVWLACQCFAEYDRYRLTNNYLKCPPAISRARQWMNRFALNLFASGLTWGYAGFFFFVESSVSHQVFLFTWITIFSVFGLYFGSFVRPIFYLACVIPALGLTGTRIMLEGGIVYLMLSLTMFVLILMMYMIVIQGHRMQVDAVRLKFRNQDLVDELKQQKEIAEKANLAKSKFLAAASHDLRQPLHALGLFASALKERIKFPEVRSLVDNINLSVSALEELFNALLDISRLDAGIILPKLQHFRVKELMGRLSMEFAEQANNKMLKIQFDGPDQVVYSDPVLLETMLRNLITNAIRFTPNGEVRVDWSCEGTLLRIAVSDTGIGIPNEALELIFQEFLQLNNPERDRTRGLGLGLAIVKRLCALLNCEITAQSQIGMGSLFRLHIPLGDAALITEDVAVHQQQPENEPSMLVLVIDDESSVREAMTILLGTWGHEVKAVGSMAEALQATDKAPDAVIADYRLRQEQTGIEAIKRIHQLWGEIPSLIVTGDTAPDRLQEAQASGFAFMHKPVNSAKLRAFLRSAYRQNIGITINKTSEPS